MSKNLLIPDRLPGRGIDLCNDARKNLEAAGLFPKRVWVTARKHAYVESEIDAYLAGRIAARDSVAA